MELKRNLYKRGHSCETTIPKILLLGLDSKKKYDVLFEFKENKWLVSFDSPKKEKDINKIRRRLYPRGSSFEVTIPKILLYNLDFKKKYFVVFKKQAEGWSIEIR